MWKKNSKTDETIIPKPQFFDAILRGLNRAANGASDMCIAHYQRLLEQYFDRVGDRYEAKIVTLQMDEEHSINLPLISLTDAKGLYLDELEVDFSINIVGCNKVLEDDGNDKTDDEISRLLVEVSPQKSEGEKRDNNIIDVKVKFKANNAPESLMKVIDKFNTQVTPYVTKEVVAAGTEKSPESTGKNKSKKNKKTKENKEE